MRTRTAISEQLRRPEQLVPSSAPVTAAIAATSDWRILLLTLLCTGLAASGLYSQAKSIKETRADAPSH